MLTARASKILDLFYESFDRLISDKLILYIKGITQQLSIVMPPTLERVGFTLPSHYRRDPAWNGTGGVYEAHYNRTSCLAWRPSPSPLTSSRPLPQHRQAVGRYYRRTPEAAEATEVAYRPPRRLGR